MTESGSVTPDDARRALQLVGFYEYGNALNHFHQLLQTSSTEELEAMDRIVKRHPEFTVYTNLSSKIETGPSSLSINSEYASEGEKHNGFAGIIALARLEFGAILAAFTDSPQPFQAFPPHAFDSQQYTDLLMDGTRTHYWSLRNDPALKEVMKASPENPIVLAYSRRLVLARSMLAATTRAGRMDYNNTQMRELSSWNDSLDDVQGVLIANIESYLTEVQQTTAATNTRSNKYSNACARMLAAEQRIKRSNR